jgi:pimeloyl-ACP methyl ester carboxylesterase
MITVPSLETWRAQGEMLTINGQRIFTAAYGTGQPALLLHGFPTASYDYARLVPLLAPRLRLVAFDFLGFGFSDKPRPHAYSLFEQADIAEAVAAHYGAQRCTIITHDMGNSVALELLRRGTLTVERIVMLNGSVLLKYYRPLITQRLLLHPLAGPLITRFRLINRRAFARQFSSVFALPPPADEIDAFWSLVNHHNGAGIYHLLIQYLNERKVHEYAWLDALHTHHAPLSVIWGQRDPVSVPQIAQAVLERRPDAHYFPLHDVGHYPQWEAPEQVAAAIE